MHTVASFQTAFPVFASLASATVQAALDDAALEIEADVWGDLAHKGHGITTADALARSPEGLQAKLVDAEGNTLWSGELLRLRKLVGVSYRMVLP